MCQFHRKGGKRFKTQVSTDNMPDGSPRESVPDGFRRVEITRQGGDVYGAMVFLSSEQLSQAGINLDRTEYIFIGPSDENVFCPV